jgi:hypothetical protein
MGGSNKTLDSGLQQISFHDYWKKLKFTCTYMLYEQDAKKDQII